MLVVNKLSQGEVKKLVLRRSRVEVQLTDGEELHYYTDEAFNKDDELNRFSTLVRDKFLDGRDRHLAQGSPRYKADTVWELQGELLDMSGYGSVLHASLGRLKKSAKDVLVKALELERSSEEEGGVITFKINTGDWDNFVSDLESISGRK